MNDNAIRRFAVPLCEGRARPELLALLAAELVQMKVDAIVIDGSPPTLAAQKATATIPLVFVGPATRSASA